MWQHAIIYPDARNSWSWAEKKNVGLPAIIRVLLTLHRSGIESVSLPQNSRVLKSIIDRWSRKTRKKRLPQVVWEAPTAFNDTVSTNGSLRVRGGILFDAALLKWFHQLSGHAQDGMACMMDNGTRSVLAIEGSPDGRLREISVPRDIFCQPVSSLNENGGDRRLLEMVGKVDEATHVRWFRNWTFPAVRFFSKAGISPNQLTWAGFLIGLVGAFILADGGYWFQVMGALLLCGSWLFDNMDGTLARLTFSESRIGEKLDAVLGHLTNLAFFTALVWAVYGKDSLLKTGLVILLMIGSITLAYRICRMEQVCRDTSLKTGRCRKLQVFLDQINGRDFTVLVLIFALLDGFRFFLWGSLAGLQVFWMLHWWLLHRHRMGGMVNSYR